jgi:hypothetical protein
MQRGFDPGRFLAAVEAHRITATFLVPTMIYLLLDDDRLAPKRRELRRFYFDDTTPGASTKKFHDALVNAIAEHRTGVVRMRELAARGTWPISD